jgi:S-adenosylmethionine hydrolase
MLAHGGPLTIITLTTDFGLADSYVAAMKGVILRIAPRAVLVDITHLVPPQDVRRAGMVLRNAAPYFPAGTIHVAVVDPGVGSARRPIAVRTPLAIFVGPDNGLFTHVLADDTPARPHAIHLDNPQVWLPAVSHTFHGRDIFAPAAAHLAAGMPFEQVGTPIDDPVLLPAAGAQRLPEGMIRGHVEAIDHFGNLISDVPARWLAGGDWTVHIGGQDLPGLSATYADVPPGAVLALIGSSGRLEVSVRDGHAARYLGVQPGEPIEVRPRES